MEQKEFQQSLDIVICVLKKKDITAINTLKKFLCSLPSLKHTEQALASAILHFANYDKSVFDWLILHQNSLSPELDLFAFTRNLVRSRLRERGWLQGRDFWFDLQNILHINNSLRTSFADYFNRSELILIRTVLNISP